MGTENYLLYFTQNSHPLQVWKTSEIINETAENEVSLFRGKYFENNLFYIFQLEPTTKSATISIYCAVPGEGRHKVIKPQQRTAPTILINIRSFSIGTGFVEHWFSKEHWARWKKNK